MVPYGFPIPKDGPDMAVFPVPTYGMMQPFGASDVELDQIADQIKGSDAWTIGNTMSLLSDADRQILAGKLVAKGTNPQVVSQGLYVAKSGAYEPMPRWVSTTMYVASIGAMVALTYHGYKRNNGSIGWALVWGLLGTIVWPITVPVALAQGFGKTKGR